MHISSFKVFKTIIPDEDRLGYYRNPHSQVNSQDVKRRNEEEPRYYCKNKRYDQTNSIDLEFYRSDD